MLLVYRRRRWPVMLVVAVFVAVAILRLPLIAVIAVLLPAGIIAALKVR
jgi:hypothetical protein